MKTGRPARLTHSRTPSNASSTSHEVAMLTGEDGSAKKTGATVETTKSKSDEGTQELTDVPLDRSKHQGFVFKESQFYLYNLVLQCTVILHFKNLNSYWALTVS